MFMYNSYIDVDKNHVLSPKLVYFHGVIQPRDINKTTTKSIYRKVILNFLLQVQ